MTRGTYRSTSRSASNVRGARDRAELPGIRGCKSVSWKMCLPLVQMSTSQMKEWKGLHQLRPSTLLEGTSQALNSVHSSKVKPCERTWQIKMRTRGSFGPKTERLDVLRTAL